MKPVTVVRVTYPDLKDQGRCTWRLETVHGRFCVVQSGTAYLTKASAKAGWRRFRDGYLRPDAPIMPEGQR